MVRALTLRRARGRDEPLPLREYLGRPNQRPAVGKACAVAETVIGGRTPDQGAPTPLERVTHPAEHLDLPRRLRDPVVQDPQQQRPGHAAAPLARRHDELADLVQREAKRLRLPDELEATEIRLRVQAIAARAPA